MTSALRLPTADIHEMSTRAIGTQPFDVLACLSFEERCTSVPIELATLPNCRSIGMLEVADPEDAFPDYSAENDARAQDNALILSDSNVNYRKYPAALLSEDDDIETVLLEALKASEQASRVLVLDISSMPKRFFCFFLLRLLKSGRYDTIVVTYTQAGPRGYSPNHLTSDPLPPDCLPGFADALDASTAIAVSIGFETLGLPSLIRTFLDAGKDLKMILPFPPDGRTIARTWSSVRLLVEGHARDLMLQNVAVAAAWDAERVYAILEGWHGDTERMVLAPYGPKPHSLAMTLLAVALDCGMYYSQPRSYSPDYSTGVGSTYCYLVRHDSINCFERK